MRGRGADGTLGGRPSMANSSDFNADQQRHDILGVQAIVAYGNTVLFRLLGRAIQVKPNMGTKEQGDSSFPQ
jgi:hypothetical protein